MIIRFDGFGIETTPSEAVEFVRIFSDGAVPKAATSEQKPKKAPANKKDLDVGKMKALRKAGWTLAEIADELGTTSGTVSKRLAKEGKA